MATMSPNDRITPEEAVSLYLSAADPTDVGRAYGVLAEVIQRIARRVAGGGTRQGRSDFVTDAPVFVLANAAPPRVRSYDPTQSRFSTWAYTVLRNEWVGRNRRARTETLCVELADTSWVPVDHLRSPFEPVDLATLGGWEAVLRVELLCLGGLWAKVPKGVWRGWVAAYWDARSAAPPAWAIPPDDWDPADPPRERTRPLADLLGCRPNRLAVVWNRNHKWLHHLAFVRDLLDPPPGMIARQHPIGDRDGNTRPACRPDGPTGRPGRRAR